MNPLVFGPIWAFVVSFKPSEPFFVSYGSVHVGRAVLLDHVLPVFAYATALAAAVAAAAAYGVGPSASQPMIVLGTVAGAVTSVIWVTSPDSVVAMQISQVLVAMSFVAHVVLRAHLYRFVPQVSFRRVASLVRSGFLLGTLVSSLLGQLVSDYAGVPVRSLFIVSAVFQGIGAFLLLIWLPKGRPSRTKKVLAPAVPESASTSPLLASSPAVDAGPGAGPRGGDSPQMNSVGGFDGGDGDDPEIAHALATLYVLWAAVLVGVHTLVLTYWQGLFLASEPTGYALAGAYTGAVFASLVPALGPVARLARRAGTGLLVALVALIAGSLHGLSAAKTPWTLFLWFILYHSVVELFVPLVHAKIGLLLVAAKSGARILSLPPPSSSIAKPLVDNDNADDGNECIHHHELLDPVFGPASSTVGPTVDSTNPTSRSASPRFTSVFSASQVLTTVVQLTLQGTVSRSQFSLPTQFLFYACVNYGALALFAIAFVSLHVYWKTRKINK